MKPVYLASTLLCAGSFSLAQAAAIPVDNPGFESSYAAQSVQLQPVTATVTGHSASAQPGEIPALGLASFSIPATEVDVEGLQRDATDIPLPASLWLFLGAILAFPFLGRKRSQPASDSLPIRQP